MSRRTQAIFLFVGIAAFALLIAQAGPAKLIADVRASGWVLVPVILVFGVMYFLHSEAWRLTMHVRPPRISLPRAYALTTWAFALNYVTPMVSVGGEPFKIAAAAQWLGRPGATASVLSERLLHMLAHILFFLTGVALAYLLLPRGAVGTAALLAATLLLLLIAALPVVVHQRGGIERVLNVLQRLPVIRRRRDGLESLRAAAVEVDAQITGFYHESPRRFWTALALEYLARALSVLEILFVARAMGVPLGYGAAYLIAAFTSLAVNLFFFIPFGVGAREGGLYAIFALLGLPPALGVVVALIGRVREMFWVGAGLALGMATRRTPPADGAPGA